MTDPSKALTNGRRPGEAVGGYLIGSALGAMLRRRRAGRTHSVLTLIPGPDTIAVASTSFRPGGPIPDAHAGRGRGANRSPQLQWAGVPSATRQLLLVMEDADVPLERPIIHLAALLPPTITGFSEGDLTPGTDAAAEVRFILGRRGHAGYQGPRALPQHGVHHYDFVLYALDTGIPGSAEIADLGALVALVDGHVLARGKVTGTQEG